MRFKKLVLYGILFLAFILRFYQLGNHPVSPYNDEVSLGYNAYSILKTAKDEYGNFLPLTFRSFDDYKPPGYVYILVPLIAIIDLNEISVRLPSAVAGTFTVSLTYVLTLSFFKKRKLALFAAFFLAISPWHIQFSRAAFEANLMVFFSILAIFLFLKSFNNSKLLIISSIIFSLALLTYQGAKVWIPLIVIALTLIYKDEVIKFGKKLIIPLAILLLSSVPFLADLDNTFLRGRSVSVFSRSERPFKEFTENYFRHFSPTFLFISGDQLGRHSLTGTGLLHTFQIPLILVGLFALIRIKKKESKLILVLLLLSPIAASLSTPSPHALRSLTFIPLWSIISSIGIHTILKCQTKNLFKAGTASLFIIVAFYNILLYLHLYYTHYPKNKFPDWQYGYRQVFSYIKDVEKSYNSIAITKYHGNPYIFTLFYLKYDPNEYQKQNTTRTGFGKFEFFDESWVKSKSGKALVVTPSWQGHPEKILKEVYAPNGDLIYRISEEE